MIVIPVPKKVLTVKFQNTLIGAIRLVIWWPEAYSFSFFYIRVQTFPFQNKNTVVALNYISKNMTCYPPIQDMFYKSENTFYICIDPLESVIEFFGSFYYTNYYPSQQNQRLIKSAAIIQLLSVSRIIELIQSTYRKIWT